MLPVSGVPDTTYGSGNATTTMNADSADKTTPVTMVDNSERPTSRSSIKRKKSTMAYKRNVRQLCSEFCLNTSAHGIPNVGRSQSRKRMAFWTAIVLFCTLFFLYQLYLMVARYLQYDTNVNIELKFESASFPAVTICNVNPYKNSLVSLVPELQRTLDSYEKAMSRSSSVHKEDGSEDGSDDSDGAADLASDADPPSLGPPRSKRRTLDPDAVNVQKHFLNIRTSEEEKLYQTDRFQPVFTGCKCRTRLSECNKLDIPVALPNKTSLSQYEFQSGFDAVDTCICFYDKRHKNGWPCYFAGNWYADTCSTCSISATCLKVEKDGGAEAESPVNVTTGCLCQNVSNVCVKQEHSDPLENYWDVVIRTPAPPLVTEPVMTKEEVIFEKAQGFQNMTDEVAITTKAKENLIFSMAAMPIHKRIALSHAMHEIIRMCSFNGKECDVEKFYNLLSFLCLRLMVYVNTTDFLPTTESSGVRIAIHGQSEFPFPDIFGYSAPTGFVSSLGIFMKRLDRLPAPYGQCVEGFHASHYIYPGYDYNTEGCYRTCFQLELINRCGCGDPRLPIPPNGGKACAPEDILGRVCLEEATAEMGGFHGSFACECPQPCKQNVYGLTYSASRWPAESYVIRGCNDSHDVCVAKYRCRFCCRKNAVMLEVYYEQLNYEKLKETEAYGWVNLVADFGGQLGLWLGLSVITWFEFAVLCYDFVVLHLTYKKEQKEVMLQQPAAATAEHIDCDNFTCPTPARTVSNVSNCSNGHIK